MSQLSPISVATLVLIVLLITATSTLAQGGTWAEKRPPPTTVLAPVMKGAVSWPLYIDPVKH